MFFVNFSVLLAVTGVKVNSSLVGEFPQLVYTLCLRRKPLYYVINIIIPCCFFSFIAASTFLLQPNCHDRLGLSKVTLFI